MHTAPKRVCKRHRPETTLLYRLIKQYYPSFVATLAAQGRFLPHYVEKKFEEFLRCGRLESGFVRVVCEDCKHENLVAFSCKKRGFCPSCGARRMVESAKLLVDDVLGGYPFRQWVLNLPIPLRLILARYPKELSKVIQIIHRAISTVIVHKAGFSNQQAKTGAVTHIQRLGSALNLNIHFHMLFLEGVITNNRFDKAVFTQPKAPSHKELEKLVHIISQRIANYLERRGLIQRDMENSYLNLPVDDEDTQLQLQGASVSYRIAIGPNHGQKVFTLQTDKLERPCRYISRPAISEKMLSITDGGKVRYGLKTPFKDGTTHVFFSPLDFIGKLAALVPLPRLNLTRFYGVFASNSNVRAQVVSSKRGKDSPLLEVQQDTDNPYHARSISWAQRLKRVFNIDIRQCESCGKENVKIIACNTELAVVQKIFNHLDKVTGVSNHPPATELPPLRAPPIGTSNQTQFNWNT